MEGKEVVLLNNIKPYINDNKIIYVWGTARDITEVYKLNIKVDKMNAALRRELNKRNAAEIKLKEEKENFKRLVENSQQGIIEINPKGKIVFCNTYYQQLLNQKKMKLKESFFGNGVLVTKKKLKRVFL